MTQDKRDLVTGLRQRTQAGRPNWDKEFARIRDEKHGKVSVGVIWLSSLGIFRLLSSIVVTQPWYQYSRRNVNRWGLNLGRRFSNPIILFQKHFSYIDK